MKQTIDKEFWDKKYENNKTGWDIGHVSTPIKEWRKYKWYLHILNTIYNDCNLELIQTRKTTEPENINNSQDKTQKGMKSGALSCTTHSLLNTNRHQMPGLI